MRDKMTAGAASAVTNLTCTLLPRFMNCTPACVLLRTVRVHLSSDASIPLVLATFPSRLVTPERTAHLSPAANELLQNNCPRFSPWHAIWTLSPCLPTQTFLWNYGQPSILARDELHYSPIPFRRPLQRCPFTRPCIRFELFLAQISSFSKRNFIISQMAIILICWMCCKMRRTETPVATIVLRWLKTTPNINKCIAIIPSAMLTYARWPRPWAS